MNKPNLQNVLLCCSELVHIGKVIRERAIRRKQLGVKSVERDGTLEVWQADWMAELWKELGWI